MTARELVAAMLAAKGHHERHGGANPHPTGRPYQLYAEQRGEGRGARWGKLANAVETRQLMLAIPRKSDYLEE